MVNVHLISDQKQLDNVGNNFDRSIIAPDLTNVSEFIFDSVSLEFSQITNPLIVLPE